MYTDALSGDIHNLTTIPASNCVHRMCQNLFKVTSSKYTHFSDINITVFGANVLGNGIRSNAATIGMFSCYHKFQEKNQLGLIVFLSGFFNQKLRVKFNLVTLNVICMFLSLNTRQKECSIIYGPGNHHSDCMNSSLTERSENRNNNRDTSSVAIQLLEFPQRHSPQNKLCFVITASDEVTTVQVAGTFNGGIQFVMIQ